MSSADLVSLEDTPLALNTSNASNDEQPSLIDITEEPEKKDTTIPSQVPLSIKTTHRQSLDLHRRSGSYVSSPLSPHHRKRQSLSFPVALSVPPSSYYSVLRTPQSAISPTTIPSLPSLDHVEPANDPAGFLTVLAGQERRVLELREELVKADAELEKLKRKWALHEATRKRSDASSMIEHPKSVELSDHSKRHIRQQSLGLSPVPKQHKRTTFHNTKHQRTLSLLSPDRSNAHSFPQPADVNEPAPLRRASTTKEHSPFLFEGGYEKSLYDQNRLKQSNQDALIATGKQMAEDFKEGLWTFIEDLRQATVGEELAKKQEQKLASANVTPLKKKGSKTNMKSSSGASTPSTIKPKPTRSKSTPKATKLVDIGDDFWSQLDPDGPLSSKPKELEELDFFSEPNSTFKKSHVKPESVRWSSSTIVSDMGSMGSGAMSPGTQISTPRTSMSSRSRSSSPHRKLSTSDFPERSAAELIQQLADSQPSQAPWGSIVNPLGNLKRTATTVLSQLEKSLAPPPQAQWGSYDLESGAELNYETAASKSKKH